MHIYITRPIPKAGIDYLTRKGYQITVNREDRTLSKRELISEISEVHYDAVLTLLTDKIDADVLEAIGPRCKIIANYAVGFDNIDIEAAVSRGIVVTNTPSVLNNAVAEHTVALMCSVSRRIVEADKFMREGMYKGWAPTMLLGIELAGKTLGIIGLGNIGSRVGHIASGGFDMQVLYHDVKPTPSFEEECNARFCSELDEILEKSDIVTLHVPLLPSTKHLIDARRLSQMKQTAILINTSRGGVIDEKALVDALSEQKIAGAGLDVFEHEPEITPGLSKLSNVVLTPHIASATTEARNAMAVCAAENIHLVLSGEEPANPVHSKKK